MAWNVHWQCCFQSFEGVQYAVNVYEQDYSGVVVSLTGSDAPFVTQEDDGEDIFSPVRVQTGYLRVIDMDGSLLESMMPSNNREKLVRLLEGTYSDGVFTPGSGWGAVKWQGFMQAQAYSQPWGEQVNVLEFPVRSLLGSLESVMLMGSSTAVPLLLGKLLTDGFGSLLGNGVVPYGDICVLSDCVSLWFWSYLPWSFFYTQEEYEDESDTVVRNFGKSYYESLRVVCTAFGLTAREDGGRLYFSHYDEAGYQCYVRRITWENLVYSITHSEPGGAETDGVVEDVGLVSVSRFCGSDNVATFIPGGKTVKVVLDIAQYSDILSTLPMATEDASQVVSVGIVNGIAAVQAHGPRSSGSESFGYYLYRYDTPSGPEDPWSIVYQSGSDYAACVGQSVLNAPLFSPWGEQGTSQNMTVGAFPCRWYYNAEPSSTPVLVNGLFLQQNFLGQRSESGTAWKVIYRLQTDVEYQLRGGYLHIGFGVLDFILQGNPGNYSLYANQVVWSPYTMSYKMYVTVRIGSSTAGWKYWNGSEWVDQETGFPITVDLGVIRTNKTADMVTDIEGGWFIPIIGSMSGRVVFEIHDTVERTEPMETYAFEAHDRILYDLELQYLESRPLSASSRTSNTYRQTIQDSGFSSDKVIETHIGSYNNNVYSSCFLRDSAGGYVLSYAYYRTFLNKPSERPEVHLLTRMAAYYAKVRRAFTGVLRSGLSLCGVRYSYQGRVFMAVDANHEWRDDRQHVKFIEVTKYSE